MPQQLKHPVRYASSERGSIALVISACAVVILLIALTIVFVRHSKVANTPNQTGSSSTDSTKISKLATGSHAYTIQSGGITRNYRIYLPPGLSGDTPLVVMMHGGGGNAAHSEQIYGWDQQADTGKFIVAYPDGLGDKVSAWNVDGSGDSSNPCCGYPARAHVNDVQFIQDMVTQIESQADIDKQRIYATGMSNGAMLSYTLACETDTFAAIGTVSGTLLDKCTNPHRVSVLDIHGLLDTHVKYDGSPGEGTGSIDGPPIPDVASFWRKVDNCQSPSTTTSGVVATSTAQCADGRTVEYISVANAGHTWPSKDADPNQTKPDGSQQSNAIDSTSTLWQFFAAHAKH
ncbi:MAG: PHB depolymerase family esterase [Candidatus Saccharimonadales bacterium]